MIKLNNIVNQLETIQERIEQKIDDLTDKLDAIEEKAADNDRDFTEAEQARYDKIEEEIMELKDELDCVDNAYDELRDWIE